MEISGLGTGEVARMLGIREATVRSHLRHARESLRRRGEEMR
jgi:DNA-directed RNA polymerase specialized sigma24 family protein